MDDVQGSAPVAEPGAGPAQLGGNEPASQQPTNPTPEGQPDGPQGVDAGQPKPAGDSKEPQISPELTKASKELARRTAALRGQQEENQSLKTENDSLRKQIEALSKRHEGDPKDHPGLKGLKADDEGYVFYNGQYRPAAEVAADLDNKAAMETMQHILQKQIEMSQAREEHVRYQEYEREVVQGIKDTRAQLYPSIPADKTELADKAILRAFDDHLSGMVGRGAYPTPEQTEKATQLAFAEVAGLFGIFGTEQLTSNQDYRDQHRIQGTGTPAVPPDKPLHQMTRAEREAWSDEAMRRAQARREAARG